MKMIEDDPLGEFVIKRTDIHSLRNGLTVDITVGDKPVNMLIDTGAAMSLLGEDRYEKDLNHIPLIVQRPTAKKCLSEAVCLPGFPYRQN